MTAISSSRVLLTGATGFIGSHLARRLVAEGAEVHAVTSTVSSVYPVRLTDLRDAITLHEGCLTDRSAMDKVAAAVRPHYVFHLGAFTHVGKSWQRVDECIQSNIQGTVNLLHALEPHSYERFVYTGTSEIYGDIDVPFVETAKVRPISPYSVSKYAGESYCTMFHQGRGWPIVMLRPFNAYGPAQTPDRIVPETIVRAMRGEEIRTSSGVQTREFNFVEDLADGFVRAATTAGVEGEVINLGCGEEVTIRELVETILELLGNPVVPHFGVLPHRPTEIWRMYSDPSKASALLSWSPSHSLREGLVRTIDWYRGELARNVDSPFVPDARPAGGEESAGSEAS